MLLAGAHAMLTLRRRTEPPEGLLKPTYQNDLRALGRHCDDTKMRGIGIYEVAEGFLLRGFTDPNDPHTVTALEVPTEDVQSLILKNFTARHRSDPVSKSPLCPTGYEDFLRALGYDLEINQAKGVALQELTDRFAVSYLALEATSEEGYVWSPRSMVLSSGDVQRLLDTAFERRGSGD